MMTEYKRIAANKAHLDATVDPTRRHLASGNRGNGQCLCHVNPQIEQQYNRGEQKRAAAVGADCTVGRNQVQERNWMSVQLTRYQEKEKSQRIRSSTGTSSC